MLRQLKLACALVAAFALVGAARWLVASPFCFDQWKRISRTELCATAKASLTPEWRSKRFRCDAATSTIAPYLVELDSLEPDTPKNDIKFIFMNACGEVIKVH